MIEPRVVYRERQVLQARDLEDEQAFHVAQESRHRSEQHTGGIVHGLALAPAEAGLSISPGLAVDGAGRDLVAAEPLPVPFPAGAAAGSAWDVWLVYKLVGPVPEEGRWREEVEPRLTAAAEPPRPPERRPADFAEPRPVLLGRAFVPVPPDAAQTSPAGRRYIRLTGAGVAAPSGGARLDLIDETGGWGWTAAVHVREPGGEATLRLALTPEGVRLRGGTVVEGDLGAGPSAEWAAPAGAPPAPAACALYRGDAGELRLQIPAAGPQAAPGRAVVVCPGEAGPRPGLLVSRSTVHIPGHLIVKGRLQEAPVQASPRDPRFATAIALTLAQGRGQAPRPDRLPAVGLEVRKLAAVEQALPGEMVDYGYAVSNTGQERLTVTLTDSRYGTIRRDAAVRPGETVVWTARLPVPRDAADPLETTVAAVGTAPDGRTAASEATHVLALRGRAERRPHK